MNQPSRKELIEALDVALLGLEDEFYAYAAIKTVKHILKQLPKGQRPKEPIS